MEEDCVEGEFLLEYYSLGQGPKKLLKREDLLGLLFILYVSRCLELHSTNMTQPTTGWFYYLAPPKFSKYKSPYILWQLEEFQST